MDSLLNNLLGLAILPLLGIAAIMAYLEAKEVHRRNSFTVFRLKQLMGKDLVSARIATMGVRYEVESLLTNGVTVKPLLRFIGFPPAKQFLPDSELVRPVNDPVFARYLRDEL